jgi:hypothetical protein
MSHRDRLAGRLPAAALWLLALVPSAYCAWIAMDMPYLGLYHDASLYWVSAKSLAQGSGYRILSLPGEPYQTKYPPLYPLALSLIWRASPGFPGNLQLATVIAWLFLPLYLLLARRTFADLGLGAVHSRVLVVLLALNPYVLIYAASLMSELPFCCLLFGCLYLATRAGAPGSGLRLAAAAGALAGAAYLTRTAVLPLLISAPLWFALRRQYRRAAVFCAAMLPAVLAWTFWVRAHPPPSSDQAMLYYIDYLKFHLSSFTWSDLPVLVSRNFQDLLTGIGGLFIPLELAAPLGGAHLLEVLGVLCIFCVVRLAWEKGASQYHLFAVGYVALLLPWQMGNHQRFLRLLFPVLPLLLAGVSREVWRTVRFLALRLKTGRSIALALGVPALTGVSLLCLWALALNLIMLASFPGFTRHSRAVLESARGAYSWISENTPADARVLSETDPLLYLYTGRHGMRLLTPARLLYFGQPADITRFTNDLAGYAHARNLRYIVLGSLAGAPARQHVMNGETVIAGPELRLVYQSPLTSVYALD